MKIEEVKLENGNLQVIYTFDPYEQNCLYHDLVSISDWYSNGPGKEKIYACQERMIKEYKEKLFQSDEVKDMTVGQMSELMKDSMKVCEMICKLPNYKNRKAREIK